MGRLAPKVEISILLLLAASIPVGVSLVLPYLPALGSPPEFASTGTTFPSSRLEWQKSTIGPDPVHFPQMTHVRIVDFDSDGLPDLLACDAQYNRVVWYRQSPVGEWTSEQILAEDVVVPAHATVADLDRDGDLDVIVAELGSIWPDDGVIGRVIWLERVGGSFVRRVLLDDVRRVADVQAGDLDGDGDVDLAVAVFGYARGQVLWLENRGQGKFFEHELLYAPGTIHVPLADYDGDGDLDISAVISQDEEELWGFENLGSGRFRRRLIFRTANFDLGSAGLVRTDLDGDGDADLLLPVGDNFEDAHAAPQPYHGCLWLENRGGWDFAERRIAHFGGTYAAAAGDVDGDGDRDVVLVSMANDWDHAENPSLVWLENDGRQNFRSWQIARAPIHLVAVDCGDLNGDGRADVVAGGLHVRPPFDRLGRITVWISRSDTATPGGPHQ